MTDREFQIALGLTAIGILTGALIILGRDLAYRYRQARRWPSRRGGTIE